MFLYTIYWGCGSIEIGLMKAATLGLAEIILRERCGLRVQFHVQPLDSLEFKNDFYTIVDN